MVSELHGLSERWFQAWLEKDATTVERLAAEDYVQVAPIGMTLDRQAIMAVIRSPSFRLDRGTRTEVVVRAVGHDAAVVRHRYQGAGSFEGTSFTDDQRLQRAARGIRDWRRVGPDRQPPGPAAGSQPVGQQRPVRIGVSMRIPASLALSVCGLVTAPSIVRGQVPASDTAAVREAVRRFHDALARSDSAAAVTLLAQDATILEAGGVESRDEYRARHLPADIRFAAAVPAKAGPLQVTVLGDVAWVVSTSEVAGTFDGRPVNSMTAELAVLTRTAAGWRIRAIHWSSRRRTPQ